MDSKIWIAVVIIVILIAGGYLYFNSGPIVSAQGTSLIKVVPDEVSVNINIETRNKTAQDAQNYNQQISEKLLLELVKIGYDKDELKFVNQNVYPDYDWSNSKQEIKGYVVSQQLVVKTNDTQKVPSIVDAVINSGALVSYINFEISSEKQSELKNQALEEASRDAKVKAQSIAAGQSKKLGRLVSLTNQNFYYPGPYNYYTRDSDISIAEANTQVSKAAFDISPNEQEISATILAEYKLSLF